VVQLGADIADLGMDSVLQVHKKGKSWGKGGINVRNALKSELNNIYFILAGQATGVLGWQ